MSSKRVKVLLTTEHYTKQQLCELNHDELLGLLIDGSLEGVKPAPLMDDHRKPTGEYIYLFQYREIVAE